jgi:general stress protein 26
MQDQNQPPGTVVKAASEVGISTEPAMTRKVLSILEEGREATLATLRADGWPQATVINYVNDEECVYFDCATASQKAHNIAADDRISLALVVPYSQYGPIFGLSLAGHARLVEAPASLSHVLELWKLRYPYMQERLEQDLSKFAFYSIKPLVVTMPDYAAGLGHRH